MILKSDEHRIVPNRMAHFVIRTNLYDEMVLWYRTVFQAEVVFASGSLTFLAFDDEHHRIALVNMPELKSITVDTTAIDHVAFTYDTLSDLLNTYSRLKGLGILPAHTMNHGPTTSFYYSDPNGNMIELQVDNFATMHEASEYFRSAAFAANAIGFPVDPEWLVSQLRGNVPERDLLRPASQKFT